MKRLSIAVLAALLTVSAFPAAALAGGGYHRHSYHRYGGDYRWGHRPYRPYLYRRRLYRRFAPVRRRHYIPRNTIPRYRPRPEYLFQIVVPFVLW